jgi:uncharacterized protein YggE
MEEPMSPVFDRRALRKRWFHLPAFAVIAAAATLGVVGVRGIDAWKTIKGPRHESRESPGEPATTTLVGRADQLHITPDTIAFAVTLRVSGKREADVARALVASRQRVVEQLRDAGIAVKEMRVDEPSVDEETTDSPYGSDGQTTSVVTGYAGTQVVEIHSTRVASVLEIYGTIAASAPAGVEVAAPQCWLADDTAIRQKLQAAAWTDIRQQAALLDAHVVGMHAIDRLASVSAGEVNLASSRDTWACTEGQTASARVIGSYWLR